MNVFTLLTNWCSRNSKPVLTREEVGIASNFTSRSSRFDSLSIVSRQSVLAILLLCLTLGVGEVWGARITYSVTSTSAVSSSGDAIAGSSASYSQTAANAKQITKDNTATLTITSMGGISISNFTLSMKSNASDGSGKLKYSTDGGKTYTYLVGSSTTTATFANAAWNGSYSSSYVDISKNVDLSNVTQLIIMIEGTKNSLYCESYSITYSVGSTKTLIL